MNDTNRAEKTTVPDFVIQMFTDPSSRQQLGPHLYFSKVHKASAAIATMSPGFETFALNQEETERVLKALRSGKIEHGYVVAAKRDKGYGPLTIVAVVDAAEFHRTVLQNRPTRSGRLGPFWTIYEWEFLGEDAPCEEQRHERN